MVRNNNIEVINACIEDQINQTRKILINEKGCKDLDEKYLDYTLRGDLSTLTPQEGLNLQREAYYYYDLYRINNLPATKDGSNPIIRCRLHNGFELEANSYRFKNVQSAKSIRNILISSNGDVTSKRESTIKESRQKYLKYKSFVSSGNIFTKEFMIEAKGDKENVKLSYQPGKRLEKVYGPITHVTYQEEQDTKEIVTASGAYSHYKILDFTLKLTNNNFTSGTLVLEDLDTDKTRIVIKVKDNQVSICKYSRKGRKIDLLDGTHNFNTIIELLEPDTSKIESPYLKRLIHAFTSGVSTTLVYGNDHIDSSDFNLSTINELDFKVSDEIKQVKSEILVPGLLSVADEYFAKEKTKDKIIRKD